MARDRGLPHAARFPATRRAWSGWRARSRSKVGAAIYATRKGIVEPVLGQIKQGRGFRRFLLRGLEKVRDEWGLVCTTHNVLKLYRICCT
ncbi:MAG TPA: transposase [Vicinamibacterales bacterium]|nr:transposase [Vicinamibacterales bacterium]